MQKKKEHKPLTIHWWQLLIFIATGVLLLAFFPRGGKFKYEYQKGKPWMHEVLIAPFDFPIYKFNSDLEKEKDSIAKNFPVYFSYNPKIGLEKKALFKQNFTVSWNNYIKKRSDTINDKYRIQTENQIYTILDIIYKNGIIEIPDETENIPGKLKYITRIKDNVAEEVEIENVFTLKQAYEYAKLQFVNYCDELAFTKGINVHDFFNELRIERYLTPNMFYDAATTTKMMQEAINNISLTEGIVLTGERIIFTGDIVTPKIYKILESLKKEHEQRMGLAGNFFVILIGQLILITFLILLVYNYLLKYYPTILNSIERTGFIFFMMVLFSFIGSMIIKYKPIGIYMIPFAIMPILLKTFFDSRIALFVYLTTILLIGFWAPNSFEFIFMNLTAGIVAIMSLSNVYRRNKIFMTAAWVTFSYFVIYIGLRLYQEGDLKVIYTNEIFNFIGNGLLILSSIPLIYAAEKLFGFLSDATLLELSDTNQPLLRKLAEKTPGTFQHSLQVANLAEEGIYRIGGNPLLIRAGALYHDIGKMENPYYFIENLSDQANPHEKLTFEESAKIIIGHVARGVEIAREYHLPEQIIDFIRTHHGTTTAHYFYRSYLKMNPDSDINVEVFTYPGPKPFSKEMAVLMIADSVEAAARSLKRYSEKDINYLVDSIIDNLIKEQQFTDADITLKDIDTIRNSFKKRLKNIYHNRIEYPQLNQ